MIMAGIPGRYGIEVVNGVVIGEITRSCSIIDPNGNEQKRSCLTLDESPEQWAKDHIDSKKAELGQEYFRLGWDKPWEIRLYE